MNPLRTVPAKRISSIRKQTDIASFTPEVADSLIDLYIDRCGKDVEIDGEPKKHHLIPEFILRNFEENIAEKKKVQAIRYQINEDKHVSIKSLDDITANGFSRRTDFYSIPEFHNVYESTLPFGENDKYRIEKFLAVLESNASSIIKFRQKENTYKANTFDNPYFYPEYICEEITRYKSSSMLNTTTGRRVAVAVFFAAQYLRSSSMYRHFIQNKDLIEKEEPCGKLVGESFPDWIRRMLPTTAKLFYSRAWRWVYSSHDIFMPDGTAIVPIHLEESSFVPATEHSLLMPFGRNSTIYFLELDTFWGNHDGVFKSKSLSLSNWTVYKLLKYLPDNFSINPVGKQKTRETLLCMHPKTTLAHLFNTKQAVDPKLKREIDYLATNNIQNVKEFDFFGEIGRL